MRMARLEKCCFSIDLKSGNIILGYFNAVLSLGVFFLMVFTTLEVGMMERDTAETEVHYAMSVILVFMFLAKFFFDILFVYGVYTEQTGIIKSYYWYIMCTVFLLLSMFVFFSNSYYYGIKIILTEVFYIVKMGIPRLEKCCFCIDLKTGNIILGVFNAVLSFGLFIIMIVLAAAIGAMERDVARDSYSLNNMEDVEIDGMLSGLYAMSIILVFLFLAKFLFDIFFIYGVYKERTGFIKAYYIMWTVYLILSVYVFFSNCYYYGIKTILTEVFYIGINVYIVLVSYSFYVQINTREEV